MICNKMLKGGYGSMPIRASAWVWYQQQQRAPRSEHLMPAAQGAQRIRQVLQEMAPNNKVKTLRLKGQFCTSVAHHMGLDQSFLNHLLVVAAQQVRSQPVHKV